MVRPLSINEKLHLVIPVYSGSDDAQTITAYIHSTPISKETFEAHFMLLSKTFAAIHAEGLGIIAGPRVAALMLRNIADKRNDEVGAMALMNEIRRLTNVHIRTPDGWDNLPFQDVVDKAAISADDISEVTNALVFFTVTSSMQRKQDLRDMMDGAARLWGAQTTSLDFTAYVASLATSMTTDATHLRVASSAVF